jgi:hypothetical protein
VLFTHFSLVCISPLCFVLFRLSSIIFFASASSASTSPVTSFLFDFFLLFFCRVWHPTQNFPCVYNVLYILLLFTNSMNLEYRLTTIDVALCSLRPFLMFLNFFFILSPNLFFTSAVFLYPPLVSSDHRYSSFSAHKNPVLPIIQCNY